MQVYFLKLYIITVLELFEDNMYDIIFIGSDSQSYRNLESRFTMLKRAETFDEAKRKSFTKFFWVVWPDVEIEKDFTFDYKVDPYDADYIHIFKNGKFYDGILLVKKTIEISNRELSYRFFANKKEIDILASNPISFDIVFISYFELQADKNFELLNQHFPSSNIFRIDGVKGIHQAHVEAAKLVTTEMFWVVDADAIIVPEFKFDYQVVRHMYDTVHVWRSRNPINGLEYGYGGVKLLPTKLTINLDTTSTDMTTSISSKFHAVEQTSNITSFNTDAFSTWRSAFRECCKLASKVIDRQDNFETIKRLEIWCTLNNDVSFGYYSYLGALAGRAYGEKNASNKEALNKINDFNWLQDLWLEEKSQLSLEHKQ